MNKKPYDIIVIGAGVCGCAIARELSRYEYRIAVLERASDICEGTSKANSGIVHAGHDAETGTLKARLNVQGNRLMKQLAKELQFSYKQNGSLVLCFDGKDRDKLEKLYQKGKKNGVEGLRMIEKEEIQHLEPNISEEVVAALFAPTGGIVCPFELNIALAENACENGVEFYLNTEVKNIVKQEEGYLIHTPQGNFEGKIVINAAGVYADLLHNMVSERKIHITPRKGEYCLFDKEAGDYLSHTIFQLPGKYGKGVLVTPTVHGNLLMGPTAVDIMDKEGVDTTGSGLEDVLKKGALSIKQVPGNKIITSFAGLRAHLDTDSPKNGGDFLIEEVMDAKGFIDVAGIESPGLTCAPAIGIMVAELVRTMMPIKEKVNFKAVRRGMKSMAAADEEEKRELIHENPAYANVICRCELVTEGEIMDAIHRPLGATTVDGVKRRTRAGMGRCQSGFCAPKVIEILARELGKDISEITKAGGESFFLEGHKATEHRKDRG